MIKQNNFRIALVGNPNSGKSSVFNQLTGLRQKVGNFPGVTVDKKIGKTLLPEGAEITLIDLPGAYSLYPNSQEERIVLNVLSNPEDANHPNAVIYVADATHLEKHLLLLTQIKDLGLPLVLALNMSDLLPKEGIEIDVEVLSKRLGIPVVPISGRYGQNMEALKEKVFDLKFNASNGVELFYQPSALEKKVVRRLQEELGFNNTYRTLLVAHHFRRLPFLTLENKDTIERICLEENFEDLRLQIHETMRRYDIFTPFLRKAIQRKGPKANSPTDKLDLILTHKIAGPIIFFFLMLLVFQAIFTWAAYPMGWIENGFNYLSITLKTNIPAGWVSNLLTDGIIAGLGGVMVFIPQIAILFILISTLEEAGYMARVVYIFDKAMQQFGLNGRSVVALVSGGACAIPAIMSTRTISNWKERLITIMVTPLISCSARIPVYTILIGFAVPSRTVLGFFNLQGLAFMGLYLLGITAAFCSAFVFKLILKTEEQSYLLLELPEYRPPLWRNVFLTVKEKVRAFVVEAGKVILVVSVLLWCLASFGPAAKMTEAEAGARVEAASQSLSEIETGDLVAAKRLEASYAGQIGKFIEPAIRPMGFDWKMGIAILTSFVAREVFVGTMATLYSVGSAEDETTIHDRLAKANNPDTGLPVYSIATSFSLLIFYVFAMQCISTLAVVRRETNSWKWPLIQFAYMSGLAWFGSLVVYQILK